jgi:putative transposase
MRQLAESYPVQVIRQVWEMPRSTYYYQSQAADEDELRTSLQWVAGQWPGYGSRRLTAQLQREGLQVNRKHIQRLMGGLGLQGHQSTKKRRTANGEHSFPRYANLVEQLEIVHPKQVWVRDTTYIRLRQEFMYLAVVMDVFTRCIRGWHLGRSLDQTLILHALEQALIDRIPEIHHSDQGVQYAANAYAARLHQVGVQISMAEVGEAWQNGYAERLMRTIKEEEVDLSEYEDYTDAVRQLGCFLDEVYMHKRIHSSLGYLIPAEFEQQWLTLHLGQSAMT